MDDGWIKIAKGGKPVREPKKKQPLFMRPAPEPSPVVWPTGPPKPASKAVTMPAPRREVPEKVPKVPEKLPKVPEKPPKVPEKPPNVPEKPHSDDQGDSRRPTLSTTDEPGPKAEPPAEVRAEPTAQAHAPPEARVSAQAQAPPPLVYRKFVPTQRSVPGAQPSSGTARQMNPRQPRREVAPPQNSAPNTPVSRPPRTDNTRPKLAGKAFQQNPWIPNTPRGRAIGKPQRRGNQYNKSSHPGARYTPQREEFGYYHPQEHRQTTPRNAAKPRPEPLRPKGYWQTPPPRTTQAKPLPYYILKTAVNRKTAPSKVHQACPETPDYPPEPVFTRAPETSALVGEVAKAKNRPASYAAAVGRSPNKDVTGDGEVAEANNRPASCAAAVGLSPDKDVTGDGEVAEANDRPASCAAAAGLSSDKDVTDEEDAKESSKNSNTPDVSPTLSAEDTEEQRSLNRLLKAYAYVKPCDTPLPEELQGDGGDAEGAFVSAWRPELWESISSAQKGLPDESVEWFSKEEECNPAVTKSSEPVEDRPQLAAHAPDTPKSPPFELPDVSKLYQDCASRPGVALVSQSRPAVNYPSEASPYGGSLAAPDGLSPKGAAFSESEGEVKRYEFDSQEEELRFKYSPRRVQGRLQRPEQGSSSQETRPHLHGATSLAKNQPEAPKGDRGSPAHGSIQQQSHQAATSSADPNTEERSNELTAKAAGGHIKDAASGKKGRVLKKKSVSFEIDEKEAHGRTKEVPAQKETNSLPSAQETQNSSSKKTCDHSVVFCDESMKCPFGAAGVEAPPPATTCEFGCQWPTSDQIQDEPPQLSLLAQLGLAPPVQGANTEEWRSGDPLTARQDLRESSGQQGHQNRPENQRLYHFQSTQRSLEQDSLLMSIARSNQQAPMHLEHRVCRVPQDPTPIDSQNEERSQSLMDWYNRNSLDAEPLHQQNLVLRVHPKNDQGQPKSKGPAYLIHSTNRASDQNDVLTSTVAHNTPAPMALLRQADQLKKPAPQRQPLLRPFIEEPSAGTFQLPQPQTRHVQSHPPQSQQEDAAQARLGRGSERSSGSQHFYDAEGNKDLTWSALSIPSDPRQPIVLPVIPPSNQHPQLPVIPPSNQHPQLPVIPPSNQHPQQPPAELLQLPAQGPPAELSQPPEARRGPPYDENTVLGWGEILRACGEFRHTKSPPMSKESPQGGPPGLWVPGTPWVPHPSWNIPTYQQPSESPILRDFTNQVTRNMNQGFKAPRKHPNNRRRTGNNNNYAGPFDPFSKAPPGNPFNRRR